VDDHRGLLLEAEVKDSEGRAFAFDSTMCGRVKHEGACGPPPANASRVAEPPASNGRIVSRPTPTPPTTRSQSAFPGQPRLFVAGQVAPQDEMVVTVRSTSSFQGMVVSAESNGRKTEAQVDSDGHAVVPVAALAVGAAAASIIAVHVLDSSRQEVAQAQTQINPAVTAAAGPPQVPALPALIPNGDVITVPGQNLGPQSQLILGNRIQETLSASGAELTSFIDAPAVRPQTAYVRTPYGTSPSQTVTAYNFTVRASQTTITRGQDVQVTAHWKGLPPGS